MRKHKQFHSKRLFVSEFIVFFPLDKTWFKSVTWKRKSTHLKCLFISSSCFNCSRYIAHWFVAVTWSCVVDATNLCIFCDLKQRNFCQQNHMLVKSGDIFIEFGPYKDNRFLKRHLQENVTTHASLTNSNFSRFTFSTTCLVFLNVVGLFPLHANEWSQSQTSFVSFRPLLLLSWLALRRDRVVIVCDLFTRNHRSRRNKKEQTNFSDCLRVSCSRLSLALARCIKTETELL